MDSTNFDKNTFIPKLIPTEINSSLENETESQFSKLMKDSSSRYFQKVYKHQIPLRSYQSNHH